MAPPVAHGQEHDGHPGGGRTAAKALLRLVGHDLDVPLASGATVRFVNLDYAASTPSSLGAWRAAESFLSYSASAHRGGGFTSVVSTEAYESAREVLRGFFGAPPGHTVILTRNTTDALNLLASALPSGTSVAAFASEHHANMLPWRRPELSTHLLPVPRDAGSCVALADEHLRRRRVDLLAVTGASNVSGELWPIGELAAVAHAHGAAIAVDAAQLAPHVPIDMSATGIDYLAASGHKMYAPFGVGVLVGRKRWLDTGVPPRQGGGAVRYVSRDDVLWADLPHRQEAGSPNVVGAVAFAAALHELATCGMDRVEEHDRVLGAYARSRLADLDGVELYRLWPEGSPRTGIALFNVRGLHHSLVSAALGAEHGIGVRNGSFCAHPLMADVLGMTGSQVAQVRAQLDGVAGPPVPGALRASVGVGSTEEDVDRLVTAIAALVEEGPQAEYAQDPVTGTYALASDLRPRPRFWLGG